MKRFIPLICILSCLFSCVKEAERSEVVELGCAIPEVTVNASAGTYTFEILCGDSFEATVSEGAGWARISGVSSGSLSGEGDGAVVIDYDANTSEERKATVLVTSGRRSLTLTLIQENASGQEFYFPQHNMLIGFEGGVFSIPFTSSVKASDISYSVEYEDGDGWIEEPVPGVAADGLMWFSALENMQPERRGAIITLSAPDKVGRLMTARLYVSQKARGEEETIPVSVLQVKNLTLDDLDGENRIRKNYVVKGRVINDDSEGNGGPCRNISIITQDRTMSSRTVYLQSEEPDSGGQYHGIKIVFKTPEDNSASRYDLLEINLKGLLYSASGQAGTGVPPHVTISDAGVVNIVSCSGGTKEDLPVIKRTINTLCEDDVNTFVTLASCEIPVRKGPFCPVDLRYRNIVNKYPMVIRDASGSIMYMVSNTDCSWARDGKGMPQGSGDISGIIVHERCDNFEWDSAKARESTLLGDYFTDEGYIGKYQIRPVTKDEIAIEEDLSTGLSKLVSEWRYCNSLYPDQLVLTARNDTIFPSWPAVPDPLASEEVNGYLIYSKGKISTGQDWTHLGPVSGGVITDIPGTNGVFDALGRSIHWNPLSYCNLCGIIQGQNGTSWHGGTWYSGDHANPKLEEYYWEIGFSTEGLSASMAPLSVTLGVSNAYGDDNGAPRYWMLSWSDDKTSWHPVTASSYASEAWTDDTAKGEDYTYTIPDFPIISSQRQYNLPGNKYISINLPSSADVWGKEMIWIRLYPAMDKSGYNGAGAVSYDDAPISNNRRSCLNYVGIRCQKK